MSKRDVERVAAGEAARLLAGAASVTAAVVHRSPVGLEVGHETLDGVLVPDAATEALASLAMSERCDGYWHGRPGIQRVGA